MWGTVHNVLETSVGSAEAYLRFEQEQQAEQGFRGEYSLYGTGEIRVIRGVGQDLRAKVGAAIDLP